MAYTFQTFTIGQILTAAQLNQIEDNIKNHVHGRDAVSAPAPISAVGTFYITSSHAGVMITSASSARLRIINPLLSDVQDGFSYTIKHSGMDEMTIQNQGLEQFDNGNIALTFNAGVVAALRRDVVTVTKAASAWVATHYRDQYITNHAPIIYVNSFSTKDYAPNSSSLLACSYIYASDVLSRSTTADSGAIFITSTKNICSNFRVKWSPIISHTVTEGFVAITCQILSKEIILGSTAVVSSVKTYHLAIDKTFPISTVTSFAFYLKTYVCSARMSNIQTNLDFAAYIEFT